MKKIDIKIKKKTKLLNLLEQEYDIKYHQKKSFLKRMLDGSDSKIDINFFDNSFTKDSLNDLQNSKIIICNSAGQKENLLTKLKELSDKIKIVYPYPIVKYSFNQDVKEDFKKQYSIDSNNKVIFFCANDIVKGGIKQFFSFIENLESKNFEILIESTTKQISQLKLLLKRKKYQFKIHFLESYPDKDILFLASDIFVSPTIQKPFSQNILRAMHYKTAVFIPQTNFASEVLDPFAVMNSQSDPSTTFKIDALLSNPNELELVQNQNSKSAQNYSLDSRLKVVKSYIDGLG